MSVVVYNYKIVDPETGIYIEKPVKLNILINCQVKLVVIDDNYDSDGGVVDSSSTFFNANLPFGGGLDLTEKPVGLIEAKEGVYQLRVDMTKSMNESEPFKSFWAKWSEKCGEGGYDPKDYETGISGPYFGLQIIQTFKGSADFAGFSHTDYLFVPYFGNKSGEKCTIKYCENTNFDFLNTTSKSLELKILTFDSQAIVKRQVQVAQEKVNFEQELKNYQAQLIAQSDELILSTYEYQPTNFTYVITRLLEFQQGTLISSLDFAENANLTQLYNLLGPVNGISNEINSLSGIYPEITIEDGEGIPYGDGIPGIYEFFGWGFDGKDLFSVVNKDATSISNYGIITRNGTEIFDTRDEFASLDGYEYFTPSDYILWGNDAGFEYGDIIECTITVTDYVDDTVNFVKSNYGYETDVVSSGVTITRGLNGGIYNTNVESSWNDSVSPSGTTWNSEFTDSEDYGWSDLANVDSRTFGTFYNALDQNIGSNIIGRELVMYDETTDEYWAVKFTSWTQGQGGNTQGGGFEYERRLINQAGTAKTFKDTLVWKTN
jgi:hypothetical protein